jgi:NADH dehydrogenase [ubiquinone] 1 alpha subcomplex assembly factor 6
MHEQLKFMNDDTSKSLKAAFSYCAQQVRTYDYHHYLCLLHLPHATCRAAFTLRAFSIESSQARDLATDPKTWFMRLLWWQEALNRIQSGKLIEHPVAQALSWVISNHKISKHWLNKVIRCHNH